VLSGWVSTGLSHCIASPAFTCDNNGFQHGATISTQAQSATYDLGTWSFDAVGDYSAAPYVEQTANGGQSNIQWLLRGSYVGVSAPALPLVGAGALAAALAVSGIRAAISARRN
jgi:phosphotransferase system  glucose/maltose/N-acetylglucosamine-specific IIC component